MTIINKKILTSSFERILSGEKKYELRLADWDCQVGDTLVLNEIDEGTKHPTGRKIEKIVTFVEKIKDGPISHVYQKADIDKFGYQIISFN